MGIIEPLKILCIQDFLQRLTSVVRCAKKLYFNKMWNHCENDIKKHRELCVNFIVHGENRNHSIYEIITTFVLLYVFGNAFNEFVTSVGLKI